MKILLVEDDPRIVDFLERGLAAEGYLVASVSDGNEALKLGASSDIDLIILDLMLPNIDGSELCRQWRAGNIETPILMLTAMDQVDNKVEGLRIGADDYMTKPFSFEELLARVEALLRRRSRYTAETSTIEIGDLVLDRDTHEVRKSGQTIDLTPKEFLLLEYLMSRPGKVVSRTKIVDRVWGYDTDPLTNIVDVHIRNIRKKLGKNNRDPIIQTVRGFGYKLVV